MTVLTNQLGFNKSPQSWKMYLNYGYVFILVYCYLPPCLRQFEPSNQDLIQVQQYKRTHFIFVTATMASSGFVFEGKKCKEKYHNTFLIRNKSKE